MERRRHLRGALVLAAAGLAAAVFIPSQAVAARLKARPISGGVVVRLVGAKPHAVRYTLRGRTVGRSRRAPYRLVLFGFRRAPRTLAVRPRLKLIARNSRTGRRIAVIRLVRTGRITVSRRPAPTITLTATPPASTTATRAKVGFSVTNTKVTSCSLDGRPFARCYSPVWFTGLARGSHTLTVLASNSAAVSTVAAKWKVVAPVPAPAPPSPPAATGVTAAPVAPPSPYALPSGAVTVSTSAQLVQALSAPTGDIVVSDGVYDNSGPFINVNGHRVYAQHLGGAVFKAGFAMGGNWGPGNGLLRGLAFDVSDGAKVLEGSIIHVWGTGKGSRVLDTTLNGHGVISSGVMARQVEGLVLQRVVARNFKDWGLAVDPNQASYTPAAPPLLEDVDSANVTWPTARASNGTAEACVWVGVKSTVRRLKARNCAWEGLWVGTGVRASTFEDLDLNDVGIGIYIEHFADHATFRRVNAGPNVDRGVTCEWADPAWGSKPACSDNVFESSYFNTRLVGVYLDEGTTRTTVRNSVFVNQRCGAIGNYAGVGNLWDTGGNDYSGLGAGAVPIFTRHLYSC